MTPIVHKIYLSTLTAIVIAVTFYLFYNGSNYYITEMEERFYHADHNQLKPNGIYGHGLGIIGTLLILMGVFGYMARKRFVFLSRVGALKHWLEFHIFLCTLGPVMILFHTAFKFGGIVSISFWSMVAVVASGVIGRFIYLQIPRTIQGRELSLHEINDLKIEIGTSLQSVSTSSIDIKSLIQKASSDGQSQYRGVTGFFAQYIDEYKRKKLIESGLRSQNLSNNDISSIMKMVGTEMALTRKIQRLVTMQKLFRYWHIAHLPFALIMLIIMIVHVVVTVTFGYTWIF